MIKSKLLNKLSKFFATFLLLSAQVFPYLSMNVQTARAAANDISASTHQGQESPSGTYTSGNVTTYKEGDFINFRFTAKSDNTASGQLAVNFSEFDGNCVFFANYFSLVSVVNVNGSSPTVTTVGSPTDIGSEWRQVLNFVFSASGEAVINYKLQLSQNAGECNGSSQHSRLTNVSGDFKNIGQQNVPVPANQIIELPEILVQKWVDTNGDGQSDRKATAGEWSFSLDGGTAVQTNADGEVLFSNVTPNGAHTVTESSGPASQTFVSGTGTNCTFNGSTATATVSSGTTSSDAVCVFTNGIKKSSITIVKDAVPNDDQDFSYTVTGSGVSNFILDDFAASATPSSKTFDNLLPGTYTFTEVAVSGWDLASINCPNITEIPITNGVSLTISAGQNLTCTFRNEKRGKVIVNKVTQPANDTTSFPVTISPSTGVTGQVNKSLSTSAAVEYDVAQGTYSVTEDVASVPGWVMVSNSCQNLVINGSTQLVNGVPTVSCTITNKKLSKLVIEKNALPNSLQDFSFSATGLSKATFSLDDDLGVVGADNVLSNSTTFSDLQPGSTFTVSENAVTGWKNTAIVCSSASATTDLDKSKVVVVPQAGEVVTCKFENTQLGSISGTKWLADVDASGDAVTDQDTLVNWVIELLSSDGSVITSTQTDQNGQFKFDGLLPESYKVREVNQSNYTQVFNDKTCSTDLYMISLVAGANVTENDFCNFMNGSISGYKWHDVDADKTSSEEEKLSNWTIFLDANGNDSLDQDEQSTLTDKDGNYSFSNLAPGEYSVCEVQQAGWVQTYPYLTKCHKVTIDESGEKNTFRNFGNQARGSLKVVKQVVNDNGGEKTINDFTFVIGDDSDTYTFEEVGENLGERIIDLPVGTYTVKELQENTSGYSTSYDGCVEVVVAVNQQATCNIKNDDVEPKVHIKKIAYGGCSYEEDREYLDESWECEDPAFGFELYNKSISNLHDEFELYPNQEYVSEGMSAGRVRLLELPTEGWFFSNMECYYYGPDKNKIYVDGSYFVARLGYHYYCDVYNEKAGSIVVTKFHDYDEDGEWDEGEPSLKDWEMNVKPRVECSEEDEELDTSELSSDECIEFDEELSKLTDENGEAVFDGLRPGQYQVSETLQEGWVLSTIWCKTNFDDMIEFSNSLLDGEDEVIAVDSDTAWAYLRPGETVNCFVGNYREPQVQIEKSNNTTGPVLRGTEVKFTLKITVPGPDTSGQLQGAFDDSIYYPVIVNDNLTDEFDYITGSFTANSNVRGDLKAAGITTDPNYASPGKWILTSTLSNVVTHNEVITLTYKAVVGPTTPAGTYATIADVKGYGDDISVVATDSDDDKVQVYVPAVLGTSTTKKLVSTGNQVTTLIFVGFMLITITSFLAKQTRISGKK